MKSISILGCGWLGKSLAIELIKSGYSVLGSTTHQGKVDELAALGIKPFLIKFDPELSSDASISHYEFFRCDTLIITIPPKRKSGQTDVYLQQINNVVSEILGGSIATVLFISSTAVYADGDRTVIESDADVTSYLLRAENILTTHTKFKTTVLRFGGLVGPGRHPGKFLAGKKDILGRMHPVNIIHQRDCIEIIKSILQQEVWNEVFNACADHHPSRADFYTKACNALHLEHPLFNKQDESKNKIVSCDKVKSKLNYHFIHNDLFEMIRIL